MLIKIIDILKVYSGPKHLKKPMFNFVGFFFITSVITAKLKVPVLEWS